LITRNKIYKFLQIKRHYFSTARSWRCEQYSLAECRFCHLEQCHIPQALDQKLLKVTSASFHTAYSYTMRQICVHVCINYWFIYMFGSILQRNFDECKLLLIMNNNWQESLWDPDVDLVFHVTTRYQKSAEPPMLHIHLTVPQSWFPK
jgi:hypothetical protein